MLILTPETKESVDKVAYSATLSTFRKDVHIRRWI